MVKNKGLSSQMSMIAAQGLRDAVAEVAANPDSVPSVFQRLGEKGDRDSLMDIGAIIGRSRNLMQERPEYIDLALETLAEHSKNGDALLEMFEIARIYPEKMLDVLNHLADALHENPEPAIDQIKEIWDFGKKNAGQRFLAIGALSVLFSSNHESAQQAAKECLGLDPYSLVENMDVLGLIKDTGGDFRTAFESQINAIVDVFKNEDNDSLEDTADLMAALAVLSENNAISDDPFQTVVKVHEDRLGRRMQKAVKVMCKDHDKERQGVPSAMTLLGIALGHELTHEDD